MGYTSIVCRTIYPVYLIKTDPETGDVVRDPKTGLCIASEYNEVGQMIGRINRKSPVRNFEGYINREDTSKKICTDVFKKGDLWFLSGKLT